MTVRTSVRQREILIQLRDEGETKLGDLASWSPARQGDMVRVAERLIEKGWAAWGTTITAKGPMVAADRSGDTITLTPSGSAQAAKFKS